MPTTALQRRYTIELIDTESIRSIAHDRMGTQSITVEETGGDFRIISRVSKAPTFYTEDEARKWMFEQAFGDPSPEGDYIITNPAPFWSRHRTETSVGIPSGRFSIKEVSSILKSNPKLWAEPYDKEYGEKQVFVTKGVNHQGERWFGSSVYHEYKGTNPDIINVQKLNRVLDDFLTYVKESKNYAWDPELEICHLTEVPGIKTVSNYYSLG